MLQMYKMEQVSQIFHSQSLAQQTKKYGFRIRVLHIKSIQSRRKINTLSLLIHTKRINHQTHSLLSQDNSSLLATQVCTSQAEKKKGVWLQDFYYNNTVEEDQYHLTLLANSTHRSTSIHLNTKAYFSDFNIQDLYNKTEELQFKFDTDASIKIIIQVSVFENEDFVVGVDVPNLSLAGFKEPPYRPNYNAIEILRSPNLNCFSCMDETITSFDKVDLVCSKIKIKNRPPS